jgi:Ser/Thr protein kinase RdoA (MazF antagonist)
VIERPDPSTSQLRQLARAALDQQKVAVRRLRWMGEHSNHLFCADTADGDRLVVRVCLPGGRSDAELDAELAWLAALARDTDLIVPVTRFSTRLAPPRPARRWTLHRLRLG